jgi:hypothetical protein
LGVVCNHVDLEVSNLADGWMTKVPCLGKPGS